MKTSSKSLSKQINSNLPAKRPYSRLRESTEIPAPIIRKKANEKTAPPPLIPITQTFDDPLLDETFKRIQKGVEGFSMQIVIPDNVEEILISFSKMNLGSDEQPPSDPVPVPPKILPCHDEVPIKINPKETFNEAPKNTDVQRQTIITSNLNQQIMSKPKETLQETVKKSLLPQKQAFLKEDSNQNNYSIETKTKETPQLTVVRKDINIPKAYDKGMDSLDQAETFSKAQKINQQCCPVPTEKTNSDLASLARNIPKTSFFNPVKQNKNPPAPQKMPHALLQMAKNCPLNNQQNNTKPTLHNQHKNKPKASNQQSIAKINDKPVVLSDLTRSKSEVSLLDRKERTPQPQKTNNDQTPIPPPNKTNLQKVMATHINSIAKVNNQNCAGKEARSQKANNIQNPIPPSDKINRTPPMNQEFIDEGNDPNLLKRLETLATLTSFDTNDKENLLDFSEEPMRKKEAPCKVQLKLKKKELESINEDFFE